jgi:hypothetical protein
MYDKVRKHWEFERTAVEEELKKLSRANNAVHHLNSLSPLMSRYLGNRDRGNAALYLLRPPPADHPG